MKKVVVSFSLIFLWFMWLAPHVFAVIPIAARIGGTVTIDGNQLTQADAAGYTFKVTKQNGTAYNPSSETAELNAGNWYIIDIPIYNSSDQPGGARQGDAAVIHVYYNDDELTVTSPVNGKITVGSSGSTTRINIIAKTETSTAPSPTPSPTSSTTTTTTTSTTITTTTTTTTTTTLSPGGGGGSTTTTTIAVTTTTIPTTTTSTTITRTTTTTSNTTTTTIPIPVVTPTPLSGVVQGFVYDADGNPAGGVVVSVVGAYYSGSVETDEEGYYEFREVPSGEYTLTYSKDGYSAQTKDVLLGEGESLSVGNVILEEAEKGRISGYVKDVRGNSLESARVRLNGVETRQLEIALTDADGYFEFKKLEADTYKITVRKSGYKKIMRKEALEARETKEIEIMMKKKRR